MSAVDELVKAARDLCENGDETWKHYAARRTERLAKALAALDAERKVESPRPSKLRCHCGGALEFHGISGMGLWRDQDGRRVQDARCQDCRMSLEIDHGPVAAAEAAAGVRR